MSDNRDILNEAFFGTKKSKMASVLNDIQYMPVDKKQVGQPGYGSILSPDKGFFAVSDPDEAKKRLVGSFGAIVGNNTIKTMASKAIKTFPIIVSDNVEPETAVMLKRVMEEQYAQYIELYISNTMINANDFATGKMDGNVAIQALSSIDSDDFAKRQGFATKTKNGGFGTAADIITKNSMLQNLLRQESAELKAGDEFTDILMEDAIIIPKEVDDMFLDYMNENMDSIMESINSTLSANGKKRLMSGECRMDALSKKVEEACQNRNGLTRGKTVQENLDNQICINELADMAVEFNKNVSTIASIMGDYMPFINASNTLVESSFPFFKEMYGAETLNEAVSTDVREVTKFDYDTENEVSVYLKALNPNINVDVAYALKQYASNIASLCQSSGEPLITYIDKIATQLNTLKANYDDASFNKVIMNICHACINGLKILGDFACLTSDATTRAANSSIDSIKDSYSIVRNCMLKFLNTINFLERSLSVSGEIINNYFEKILSELVEAGADTKAVNDIKKGGLRDIVSSIPSGRLGYVFFPTIERQKILRDFVSEVPSNIDDINTSAYKLFVKASGGKDIVPNTRDASTPVPRYDDDIPEAIPVFSMPFTSAPLPKSPIPSASMPSAAAPPVEADKDDPDFNHRGVFADLGYISFAFDRSVYISSKNNKIIESISSENEKLQTANDDLMKAVTDAHTASAAATAASRAEDNEALAEKQSIVKNSYEMATKLAGTIRTHVSNIQDIKAEFDRVKELDAEAINQSRNIVEKVRNAYYDIGARIQKDRAVGKNTSELEYLYKKLQYRYSVAEVEAANGKFAQKFYSDNTSDIIKYTADSVKINDVVKQKISELEKLSKSTSKIEFAPTQNLKDYMQNLAKNDRSSNSISFLSNTDISDIGTRTMSTGNLDSTEIVVNKNLMDKVVERRVMDILNSDKELRAWYEEATFLLQARKINAREYISYVTERLGLPMSDNARKELVLRFKDVKFADIRQNFGLITDGDIEAAAENASSAKEALLMVNKTKVGTALKGLVVGGGSLAAVGLLATPFMLTVGLPIVAIGGVVGGVSALILAIRKKLAKRKLKVNSLLKVPRGDWRVVEKMINIIEQQRKNVKAAYKEASGANIGTKDLADFVNRSNVVDPDVLNKAIERAQRSMALTEDDFILDGILETQTWADSKVTINHLAEEATSIITECIEENEDIKNELIINEAVISTTTPIKLVQKYSYDTHAKPEIMVTPEYSAKANKAYGSVEYDKRDLKDRRYNSPLMLKINFKQRFADGTYSDNEMTAVIGILGVITRVPSEEMKEILRSNIQDITLHGVLSPEGGKDNKASIMNVFAASKKNPKLEVSSELWNNLEKMSKMAFVNRLAGRQNDNIANAHIIFSQKEIDDVKSETNVDYLRDKKVVAKLMKRYNAFTIVVTNDIAERLYIFDDLDNINWNVVPYSALRSKDSSTDTMVSAIQKLRNL